MYKIFLKGIEKKYEYEELIKIFINPDEYEIIEGEEFNNFDKEDNILIFNETGSIDKNQIKREIYIKLSEITGIIPEWGILTGVRPVKIAAEFLENNGNKFEAHNNLKEIYLLGEQKANLIIETALYQDKHVGKPEQDTIGVYIGIPFCPTRCLYCSFASNQVSEKEIDRYTDALIKEIDFVGKGIKKRDFKTETLYIGGGTPTSLSEKTFEKLLTTANKTFSFAELKEVTVEAGRPDTITTQKLKTIKNCDICRISINPQSMKDKTLEIIGRSHSSDDIRRAYFDARNIGIPIINCDIIAGLPEENPEDFAKTLEELIAMKAENITVHTLAVKRASKLIDIDKNFHYKQSKIVKEQLEIGEHLLRSAGYIPYYLYRQKYMAGALENIGWCKPGTECIYNTRIMEEKQTIIALGAGGISKAYYPLENRIERVPNVTNYEIYIERLDEMIQRKKDNIFEEDKKC